MLCIVYLLRRMNVFHDIFEKWLFVWPRESFDIRIQNVTVKALELEFVNELGLNWKPRLQASSFAWSLALLVIFIKGCSWFYSSVGLAATKQCWRDNCGVLGGSWSSKLHHRHEPASCFFFSFACRSFSIATGPMNGTFQLITKLSRKMKLCSPSLQLRIFVNEKLMKLVSVWCGQKNLQNMPWTFYRLRTKGWFIGN